jgi:phage-related protein
VGRSENIFTDFWNWLVGEINQAVQAIENVIVSVADDIMVGINFIVNGVKQVFKAIIKVVEDVVNAIGSFFMQLAKP